MNFGTSSLRMIFVLLFLFLASCAKKEASPSVTIQLNSQGVGAFNTGISNVFVNISGPGGLIIREWDCERGQCNADFSFTIERVQSGTSLVQVLVVADTAANGTTIYYGDLSKDISLKDNVVPIRLEEKGNFNSEGKVVGRYIPSSGHPLAGKKLTGDLEMNVSVGVGKPDMKLMKREIFGGWTSLMVLDTLGFKYLFFGLDSAGNVFNGVPVLNDLHDVYGLKMSSLGIQPTVAPAAPSRALYNISSLIWSDRNGVYSQRPFDRKYVGLFGDVSDLKKVCAKNLSSTFTFDDSSKSRICKTFNSGTNQCTSFFQWSDFLAASLAQNANGTSDTCGSNTDVYKVDLESLGNGDRGLMGFFGPFVEDPSFSFGLFDVDDTNGIVSWKIGSDVKLPGKVAVFISSDVSGFDSHDIETHGGIYDCNQLPPHFERLFPDIDANPGNVSSFTFPADKFTVNSGFALCPMRPDGRFFGSALVTDDRDSNGGQPTRVVLAKVKGVDGFSGNLNRSVCVPFSFQLQDNSGNLMSAQGAPFNINIGSGDANNHFYSNESDCLADNTSNQINALTLQRDYILYFRAEASADGNYTLMADESSGVLTDGSFTISLRNPPALDSVELIPDFQRNQDEKAVATTETCTRFYLVAKDADGEIVSFNGSAGATMGPNFYNTSDCTGAPVTGFCPSSSDHFSEIYYANPTIPQTVTGLSSCNPLCRGSNSLVIVNPGSFHHFFVNHTKDPRAGDCVPIRIGAYDGHQPNSYPTTFPDGNNITYINNSTGGGLLVDDTVVGTAPYECDSVTTTDMLALAPPGNLGPAPVGPLVSRNLFYLANKSTFPMDIDFSYNGVSRNISQPVWAPSGRAYLTYPATQRPFVNFTGGVTVNLTMTNEGDTAIASTSITASGEFSISSNGCSSGVAAGGSCVVSIYFNTGSPITVTDVLYLTYFDGSTTRSTPIPVNGVR